MRPQLLSIGYLFRGVGISGDEWMIVEVNFMFHYFRTLSLTRNATIDVTANGNVRH